MTDRDGSDEARIRAAFLSETRRAEADLRSDPLVPRPRPRGMSRSRRSRTLAGLVAVAVVAILVAAAVGVVRHSPSTMSANPSSVASPTSTKMVASPLPSATFPSDRYSDGIPRTFDGQPVLRWGDAVAKARTTTEEAHFLVGVWLDVYKGLQFCPAMQVDPSAPDSWTSSNCNSVVLSVDAGAAPIGLDGVATFHFATSSDLNTGPAILRVHTQDSRSTECGSQQATCEAMMVVEDAIWTGDSETDPQPFTVADVIAAAASVEPATALEIQTPSDLGYDLRLSGAVALSKVSPARAKPADMQISGAYLMPTDEAMKRALPDVQPGAAGAMLKTAWKTTGSGSGPGYSYTVENRWLVVDNVAFSVRTASPPTAADQAWMASLQTALWATR